MSKIMKSVMVGLFVILFLVGHVQATSGGNGGSGGNSKNPYVEAGCDD